LTATVEAISKSVDPEDKVEDYVKVFKSHGSRLQNAAKVRRRILVHAHVIVVAACVSS
jgi:tetrahydrodipicolinate N-succinyltransferase